MPVVHNCPDCVATSFADGCPKHSGRFTYAYFERKPFRCPVCEGRGVVSPAFYGFFSLGMSTSPVLCHACKGEGVLWADDAYRAGTSRLDHRLYAA